MAPRFAAAFLPLSSAKPVPESPTITDVTGRFDRQRSSPRMRGKRRHGTKFCGSVCPASGLFLYERRGWPTMSPVPLYASVHLRHRFVLGMYVIIGNV